MHEFLNVGDDLTCDLLYLIEARGKRSLVLFQEVEASDIKSSDVAF